MKYRIALYLFLLGIASAIYFIELESISYLASRGLFWFLVIFLTSFISTLFKLGMFVDKEFSFLFLLMLSVAEIIVMVLFATYGIFYASSSGVIFPLIFIYIGAILALYTLIDKSSGIFSNAFTSFVLNSILFIIIFFVLAPVFHIQIRIM